MFGVVGLLADFTVLFVFATGVSSIREYIPASIPTPSALLFFSLTTALIIFYGWFIVSWYLVRRSFVLLGQMPVRFHYPLVGRAARTVSGIGIFLIPVIIAWSIVNLPDDVVKSVEVFPTLGSFATHTPVPDVTQTAVTPPALQRGVYLPETNEQRLSAGWTQYFIFCFPFFSVLFGFIVWLPINLLMPIVHVELLLQEASPDIMDELREYFDSDD